MWGWTSLQREEALCLGPTGQSCRCSDSLHGLHQCCSRQHTESGLSLCDDCLHDLVLSEHECPRAAMQSLLLRLYRFVSVQLERWVTPVHAVGIPALLVLALAQVMAQGDRSSGSARQEPMKVQRSKIECWFTRLRDATNLLAPC